MRNSQQKMLEGNYPVSLKWFLTLILELITGETEVHSSEMFHPQQWLWMNCIFSRIVCSKSGASSHYQSRAGPRANPVAFKCTHADRTVLHSGLKMSPLENFWVLCRGAPLGRLWIHLDFISELFWFPGVDSPGPYPPKRDWGRENDVILSLKSYSCS